MGLFLYSSQNSFRIKSEKKRSEHNCNQALVFKKPKTKPVLVYLLPLLGRFNNRHISEEINVFNEVYSDLLLKELYLSAVVLFQVSLFVFIFLGNMEKGELWR